MEWNHIWKKVGYYLEPIFFFLPVAPHPLDEWKEVNQEHQEQQGLLSVNKHRYLSRCHIAMTTRCKKLTPQLTSTLI